MLSDFKGCGIWLLMCLYLLIFFVVRSIIASALGEAVSYGICCGVPVILIVIAVLQSKHRNI